MKLSIICTTIIFFTLSTMGMAEGTSCPTVDTVKYQGYRLELTNFKLVKKKDDWIKLEFDVVNSGRMNVDLGREGTEHWVVFRFDQSLFSLKMGGFREHIKYQLVKEKFKLDKGKVSENVLLKIPTVLPMPPQTVQAPLVEKEPADPQSGIDQATNSLSWNSSNSPTLNDVEFSEKGGSAGMPTTPVETEVLETKTCPDVLITDLKIIEQNDRHATLEYTIANQGTASFYLFGSGPSQKDNLYISTYLSGVTTLTRGALPIGGEAVTEETRNENELKPGERFIGRIKVDVRKKTRYMKSLVLHLESAQYAEECDRKNNDRGVVLE